MTFLTRNGPLLSFLFCFLGGAVLLLDGIDKENGLLCGVGLFFTGMAFFVGPMLWLAAAKYRSASNSK